MAPTVLHFVFTASGSGCLVQALRTAGRNDQVIATFDDLSFGPIDPGDSSSRAKWVESELGWTGWNDGASSSERLWDEARFPDNRKVAWLTRRSAMEYAGFLNWLWQLGDADCEVVDLTDVRIFYPAGHGPPQGLAMSLGLLHPDIIKNNVLWDLAEPLPKTTRARYLDLWRQLRSENAPLRVIDGDQLVSAPMSFFDSVLLSHATDTWQKVARIIGEALSCQMDDCLFQTGDIFLAARVNALVESGRLEIRGKSALEMHFSEVRLPNAQS